MPARERASETQSSLLVYEKKWCSCLPRRGCCWRTWISKLHLASACWLSCQPRAASPCFLFAQCWTKKPVICNEILRISLISSNLVKSLAVSWGSLLQRVRRKRWHYPALGYCAPLPGSGAIWKAVQALDFGSSGFSHPWSSLAMRIYLFIMEYMQDLHNMVNQWSKIRVTTGWTSRCSHVLIPNSI